MKAVVLHEYGGPDQLKYEDWDDPHKSACQGFSGSVT
jgi:NADPH:quinone reductase-like Zn-dependent oxidoreductase